MNGSATIIWRAIGAVFVVFLLSPLALVVLFSFTSRAQSAFPIEALSLQWWGAMFADANFAPAFWNSIKISGTVGLLSAIVGTMAAMGLARLEPARAYLVTILLCLPLMLPPLVLAVALLSFYSKADIPMSWRTVAASHLLAFLPFVVLVVFARRALSTTRKSRARAISAPRRCGRSLPSPFPSFGRPSSAPR